MQPISDRPVSFRKALDDAFSGLTRTREQFMPRLQAREVGTITTVSTGIAKVAGLPGLGFEELVKFAGDLFGIAFNLDEEEVGVVLLGECWHLHAGDEVERTGRVMDVPAGDGLIGRVMDPLGEPLDQKGPVAFTRRLPLERATHLRNELGGGSLTALAIIETEAQNISAYIPTDLISITDGQLYLSPTLFELAVLPAVDVGKSVSRVGGKAQLAAYRAVTGDLKLACSQFEELETFARFGTRLDEHTRSIIEHGRRIRACLKQPQFETIPVPEQIAVLVALTGKLFDNVPLDRMGDAERTVRQAASEIPAAVSKRFASTDRLSDTDCELVLQAASEALASLQKKP